MTVEVLEILGAEFLAIEDTTLSFIEGEDPAIVIEIPATETLVVDNETLTFIEGESSAEIIEVGLQGPPGPPGDFLYSDPLAYYILASA